MSEKKRKKLAKRRTYLSLATSVFLWIFIFFSVFYKGSVNVGMWGKWQGLEIVVPLFISAFVATIVIVPIYLLINFFGSKK
jgi:predicted small integral membrane protein